MNRWNGRVAVVTGASAGIGEAIVKELAKHNIIVAGLARRKEKLEEISTALNVQERKRFYAVQCDVSKENDIVDSFKSISENAGPVSILVNNAAVMERTTLLDADAKKINIMFQTNVTAPILCSKEVIKSMCQNNIDDGYIININSVIGNNLLSTTPDVSTDVAYSASKHALRVVSQGLRRELNKRGKKIRVTNLCPGLVKTDMSASLDTATAFPNVVPLEPKDIANACIMLLQTHPNVEVPEVTVTPVSEAD